MLSLNTNDMPLSRKSPKKLSYVPVKYESSKSEIIEESIECHAPVAGDKVLLHSCCAPCSGAMIEECITLGLNVTVFFYNPNIHPRKEYIIRKEENLKYCRSLNIPFVDCDYDSDSWFTRMAGLEFEPERGIRCTACFDMRMEVTASYANEHKFPFFTTTNATSRWKDSNQVNASGLQAARQYMGLTFWIKDWKDEVMTKRKYKISEEERFYKQEYCGCSFSLRDSNIWRKQNGIDRVRIGGEEAGLGTRYFENAEIDSLEESQEVVDQFFLDASCNFGDEERKKIIYEGRKKQYLSSDVGLNNW